LNTARAGSTAVPVVFPDDHAKKTVKNFIVWTHIKQVRAVVLIATDGLYLTTIQREQLSGQDIGPILEEMETRQHSEWKDIADSSPTYKTYWAQWKSIAVRDVILKLHWNSTSG
jgi:hypothetical protein